MKNKNKISIHNNKEFLQKMKFMNSMMKNSKMKIFNSKVNHHISKKSPTKVSSKCQPW